MSVKKIIIFFMVIVGVFVGFGGVMEGFGIYGMVYVLIFFLGIGFDGIVVVLFGGSFLIGIVFFVILFGVLKVGVLNMLVVVGVLNELVNVIIVLIIFFVVFSYIICWVMVKFKKGVKVEW